MKLLCGPSFGSYLQPNMDHTPTEAPETTYTDADGGGGGTTAPSPGLWHRSHLWLHVDPLVVDPRRHVSAFDRSHVMSQIFRRWQEL